VVHFYLRKRGRPSLRFSSLFIFYCCICILFRLCCCCCYSVATAPKKSDLHVVVFGSFYLFILLSIESDKNVLCAGRAMNLLETLWAVLIGTAQCKLISCGRRKYDILLEMISGDRTNGKSKIFCYLGFDKKSNRLLFSFSIDYKITKSRNGNIYF